MSDVFDERLEEAIARDPDDPAVRQVYADWLQQAGNPRGELAAVQLARELDDSPALRAREAELLAAHADDFAGAKQADGFRIPDHCNEITYRAGFWKSVQFSGTSRVLEQLVAHPSARLLQRLMINYIDNSDEDYTAAIGIVATARWPALRELVIGNLPEGQSELAGFGDRNCGPLAALADVCPRLDVLRLLCPMFEAGDHPTLRMLDARLGATPASIVQLALASLPNLQILDLGFDNFAADDDAAHPLLQWEAVALDPLFERPPPKLERLRVWPMGDGEAVVAKLVERNRGRVNLEIMSGDDYQLDDPYGTYIL